MSVTKPYPSASGQIYKRPAQHCKHPSPNYVPVVGCTGKPLMPCHPQRARELMMKGKAQPCWMLGRIFYIQLTEREDGVVDPNVVIGIDPGSKFEGYSIRSSKRTLINIQSAAPTHVKSRVADRRDQRRARRFRNTPCRQNRSHRGNVSTDGRLPPSTRARCLAKINLVKRLMRIYPISKIVIEDVVARTKKGTNRNWNKSFSPLQAGKLYLYAELQKLVDEQILLIPGYTTYQYRSLLKTVAKTTNKAAKIFEAHCLDAWVLAGLGLPHEAIEEPDNLSMYSLEPILLHRRQLHATQPTNGNIRRPYGGTRSMGLKRGSLVHHPKYAHAYVGGTSHDRISLHSLKDGKRLAQNVQPEQCQILAYNTMKIHYIQRAEMTCKICGKTKPIPQRVLTKRCNIGSAEYASSSPACSPECYRAWIHIPGKRGNPFQRRIANT